MRQEAVAIPSIAARVERLRSYSGVQKGRAAVARPANVDELRAIFDCARRERRCVTFRAGGCSFDAQSLSDDIVVSMERFDHIGAPDNGTIEVGAGATWGRILQKLEAYGHLPAVTVTTRYATAGGTLSGDCLSRFSAAYGREGRHVARFKLMTPDGVIHECVDPNPDDRERVGSHDPPMSREDQLFYATIGGLGYLGAVLSVTYKVLDAPADAPPTVVQTEVGAIRDVARYVDRFVDCVRDMHEQQSTPKDARLHDAVYSAVSLSPDGDARAFVFRSTYKGGAEGRPLLVYRPDHPLRVPVELLLRFGPINRLIWWLNSDVFHRRPACFVNGLADFTFFMDGNGRVKRFARRMRIELKTLQQTYIIPSDFTTDDTTAHTKKQLHDWLVVARDILREHRLAPTFQDVVWLPHDEAFPLSSTATSGGFAVSYAFDCNFPSRVRRTENALTALSRELAKRGGRVHLVKNVYAPREVLAKMHDDRVRGFLQLKQEVDPDGILDNAFFDEKVNARAAG